jgi:RNA polymerase sigma-70 factor (ECF subfamily)
LRSKDINILDKTIERAKKGNAKAYKALYLQYSKAMFNVCLRMTNSREDAEDVLQDAFIDAFRNLGSFNGKASFGLWLKRIVINKCINALKKKTPDIVLTDNYNDKITDDDVDFEDKELKIEKINRGIKKLPDGYRVILTLYLFEGYDHQEISQILNISESTSKSQYMRAKKKLKEIILRDE